MHDHVASAAARHPDATALRYPDAELSYAELDGLANALADDLSDRGVSPGMRVVVTADQRAATVVALLGVLKCGACYVPVDELWPRPRMQGIFDVVAPAATIGTRGSPLACRPLPYLDLDRVLQRPVIPQRAAAAVGGEDLAYVMFTSGSTGVPKGVCIPHRAVVRTTVDPTYVTIEPGQVVAQAATLAFDAATFELWAPLSAGACVKGIERAVLLDPRRLARRLQADQIDTMFVTTAIFDRMAADLPDGFGALEHLLFGGEAVNVDAVAAVVEAGPPRRLVHVYGPTEVTTFATAHVVERRDVESTCIPIGRPIGGTTAHIVDPHGALCPDGPGELLLGGERLATGYDGDARLTAERFVVNGFEPEDGSPRLYRTGDIVRRRDDGAIVYVGRADDQVKVRGFRVQLGEVESALACLDGVQAAVACVRPGRRMGDGSSLVAFVEPDRAWWSRRQGREVDTVDSWRAVFDRIYAAGDQRADPRFDTAGWIDGATGEAYSAEQMREWVSATVDRVRALGPERVLEVGVGTGMILWELAPATTHYVGTDISERAVRRLQDDVRQAGLDHVDIRLLDAAEIGGLDQRFDLVILNSVVQYLPSWDHLVGVVDEATSRLDPGGHIFLGDVRHLGLLALEGSETGLGFASGPAAHELAIDPRAFGQLTASEPRLSLIEVTPRRGRAPTAMTRFRYDVLLRVGAVGQPVGPDRWLDWTELPAPMIELIGGPAPHGGLGILDIPNARTSRDAGAVDPEMLHRLGEANDCHVLLSWRRGRPDGRFDALLLARARWPAPPALVGFPQAEPGRRLSTAPEAVLAMRAQLPRIREELRSRLPIYMVPSLIIPVDELPLNDNGKVDRARLNEDRAGTTSGGPRDSRMGGAGGALLRDEIETIVADIWRTALGVADIDPDDSFFDIGGHSLLAVGVLGRLQQELGVDLNLVTFFDAPTLGELCAAIRAADGGAQLPPVQSAPAAAAAARAPLSCAQRLLAFVEAVKPGSSQNPRWLVVSALELDGDLDASALDTALAGVVARHDAFRTTLAGLPETPHQRIAPVVELPLLRWDLTGGDGVDARHRLVEAVAAELQRPLDLRRPPLARAFLARLAPQRHVLVLLVHHTIYDYWSANVLWDELGAGYRAALGEATAVAPRPGPGYGELARRRAQDKAVVDRNLAYWQRRLAGLQVLRIPTDRSPASTRVGVAGVVEVAMLEHRIAGPLAAVGAALHASGFMASLAVFIVVLAAWARTTDIFVPTFLAGRRHAESHSLVGFFLLVHLIRTDLSDNPSFEEIVQRVKQAVLEADDRQEVPFDQLVGGVPSLASVLGDERQVLFLFQYLARPARADFGPVAASPSDLERQIDAHRRESIFDLLFTAQEVQEGLEIVIRYNPQLFDAATIGALARAFTAIASRVGDDPHVGLADLCQAVAVP